MDWSSITRRVAAAAWLAAVLPAGAQEAKPSFAVLSEMAHDVRVVVYRSDIGTRLGANIEDRLPIKDGALDKVTLVTAKAALQSSAPGAPIWLVSPIDSDLFDARQNFTEGSQVAMPDDLAQALKAHGSTQLLLFTRHKADAALRAHNANLGSGQLEGIGFFIDGQTEMTNRTTLATSIGFLAPFIYVRATLIDVASGKVIRTRRITQSSVRAADRADQGRDPWNVLSSSQKVQILADMIVSEVTLAVPALLTPP